MLDNADYIWYSVSTLEDVFMKKFINITITFAKVTGSISGVLFALFVVMSAIAFTISESGLDPQETAPRTLQAKARCTELGGKWIVNPNSYIPHRIYGEGCDIDYKARAERAKR